MKTAGGVITNLIVLVCVATCVVIVGWIMLFGFMVGMHGKETVSQAGAVADATTEDIGPATVYRPEKPATVHQSIRDGMAKLQDQAYYTARRFVQGTLKSPSSATFSTPGVHQGTGVAPYGFYQWEAAGWVDAKNPMGVMLRYDWQAVVQYRGGVMSVVWTQVGDTEFGSRPDVAKAPSLAVKTSTVQASAE